MIETSHQCSKSSDTPSLCSKTGVYWHVTFCCTKSSTSILIQVHILLEAEVERWFHHLKFIWMKGDMHGQYGVLGASAPFEDARDQCLLLCGELGSLEYRILIWRSKLRDVQEIFFCFLFGEGSHFTSHTRRSVAPKISIKFLQISIVTSTYGGSSQSICSSI
jgi:hypothetical protein